MAILPAGDWVLDGVRCTLRTVYSYVPSSAATEVYRHVHFTGMHAAHTIIEPQAILQEMMVKVDKRLSVPRSPPYMHT